MARKPLFNTLQREAAIHLSADARAELERLWRLADIGTNVLKKLDPAALSRIVEEEK